MHADISDDLVTRLRARHPACVGVHISIEEHEIRAEVIGALDTDGTYLSGAYTWHRDQFARLPSPEAAVLSSLRGLCVECGFAPELARLAALRVLAHMPGHIRVGDVALV